jgi:hypothetical protein
MVHIDGASVSPRVGVGVGGFIRENIYIIGYRWSNLLEKTYRVGVWRFIRENTRTHTHTHIFSNKFPHLHPIGFISENIYIIYMFSPIKPTNSTFTRTLL